MCATRTCTDTCSVSDKQNNKWNLVCGWKNCIQTNLWHGCPISWQTLNISVCMHSSSLLLFNSIGLLPVEIVTGSLSCHLLLLQKANMLCYSWIKKNHLYAALKINRLEIRTDRWKWGLKIPGKKEGKIHIRTKLVCFNLNKKLWNTNSTQQQNKQIAVVYFAF